jgi:hypothetical protein
MESSMVNLLLPPLVAPFETLLNRFPNLPLAFFYLDNVPCKRNAIRFPQVKLNRIALAPIISPIEHFVNLSVCAMGYPFG